MTSHKHIDIICIIMTVVMICITVLFINGESLGMTVVNSAEAVDDLSDTSATEIVMDGTDISITGTGAYTYEGDVYISSPGYYRFTGTLEDGSIVVNTENSAKVWLILNGVDISCSDGACIRVEQADKVYINLAEGSSNTLTDGEEYSEEAVTDNVNGVIWSSSDLIIDGTGSLTVNGSYHHGIKAKDDLDITGGTITITAPADGIHVNDDFYMSAGNLTIDVEDDAIHADLSIHIAGGTITATNCYEGLESATIQVDDGDITLYPKDDGFNANGITSSFGMGGGTGFGRGNGGLGGKAMNFGGGDDSNTAGSDGSGETTGSESGNTEFRGGHGMGRGFKNQNGSTSGSDTQTDESGSMPERPEGMTEGEMPAMPEGMTEGEMPEPPEGMTEGEMPAMPEGLSGSGESEFEDRSEFGAATADTGSDSESEECYVLINGGNITIINETANDADGIDSNKDIIINGGNIYVSLRGSGSNNAMDCGSENGGVITINGGNVVAAGASNMAESPDSSSAQASIFYNCSEEAEAGERVTLTDSDGNVIIDTEVKCSFTSICLSNPDMRVGETYTLSFGDVSEELTLE